MPLLKLEWKLSDNGLADLGFAISNAMAEMIHRTMPELADLFPFKGIWELNGHLGGDWLAVRVINRIVTGMPSVGTINEAELASLRSRLLPFTSRSHDEIFGLLGSDWISFDRFTYVGPYNAPHACWSDLSQHLGDWLTQHVLPEVFRRNQARVLRAIPQAPRFDLDVLRRACWVLECERSNRQGTAFSLEGVGLVTCHHVLGPETMAFRADSPGDRFPVEIIAENEDIDIAVLRGAPAVAGTLEQGSADCLSIMDHVAVIGYPNYRLGDSGIIVPGLVVGFRPVSGIRRILTNAPIVAGTSGGPVLGADNRVLGLAVTGADQMENASTTENHGIIPIDALRFLFKQ
jgi:S1-C subfamily serine protease